MEKDAEQDKRDKRLRDQITDIEQQLADSQSKNERHLRTIKQSDADIKRLNDKLDSYTYAVANNQMAQIPRTELILLRNQAADLETMEKNVAQLEKSKTNLQDTISKLREGKDACGHEAELKDLQRQLDRHSSLIQEKEGLERALSSTKKAHELLKMNQADLKQQMAKLQKSKSGEVVNLLGSGKGALSLSKGVQAKLADSFTLRQLTPEFKNALRHLGAKHPQAYEEFVHNIQPSDVRVSRVKVGDVNGAGGTLARQGDVMMEEPITAHRASGQQTLPPGTATVQGGKPAPYTRPIDGATGTARDDLIGQLVDSLPLEGHVEGSHWQTVEDQKIRRRLLEEARQEENKWGPLEGIDDVTLTVNFRTEMDDSSSDSSIITIQI